MKHIKLFIIGIALLAGFTGCKDFLEVEPTDSITADALFASNEGIQAYLATLYREMPMEDNAFMPTWGFHYQIGDSNNNGNFEIVNTDDATGSQTYNIIDHSSYSQSWAEIYEHNNHVNSFFGYIDQLKKADEATKQTLRGEAWFLRGYLYFALAKRYGGVPIITEVGDVNDSTTLYIPRSTEVETWDYILECCDSAASYLPTEFNSNHSRATKWAALALKSEAALHAASLAKYWDKAPLSGEAVDKGLVGGFTNADMNRYYQACIDASAEVINGGALTLVDFGGKAGAAAGYQDIFEHPTANLSEVIFLRGFEKQGVGYGYNIDHWGNPKQTRGSWPHPGRFNPTVEFVDNYEYYSKEGEDGTMPTLEGGKIDNYEGYDASKKYVHYASANGLYADKDQRLWGTCILPSTTWKNTEIIIQAGFIKPDGECIMETQDNTTSCEYNGKKYYVFGASGQQYSGFDTDGGNYTTSGFLFKKFLDEDFECMGGWNYSTTDYIDMRLPQVYLNYAEAYAESGLGDASVAKTCLNATRHRVGFVKDLEPNITNVLRERRAELSFEQTRAWDLIRRREFHEKFEGTIKGAMKPVYDVKNGDYIFVRQYCYYASAKRNPLTFNKNNGYYRDIPGISGNGLVQNP